MAQIKLEPGALLSLAAALEQQRQTIGELAAVIGSVQFSLDMEISASAQIAEQLSRLRQTSSLQEELLRGLNSSLNRVVDDFSSCDKRLAAASQDVIGAAGRIGTVGVPNGLLGQVGNVKIFQDLAGYSAMSGMFGGAVLGASMAAVVDPTQSGEVWGVSFGANDLGHFGVLGYNVEEDSAEAYLARLTGQEVTGIYGDIKATTNTGATVGSVQASAFSSAEFWGMENGSSAKEGFDYKGGNLSYLDGSMKNKSSWTLVNVGAGAKVGATGAALDYSTTIGTDDLSGTVGGSFKVADVDLGAKAGVKIDNDGFSAALGAEAGATLAEVEGSAKMNIGDWEVGTTVSAEIGFGASAGFELDDGKLDVELGAAFGIGGKVKFSVKVPDLGLPWW